VSRDLWDNAKVLACIVLAGVILAIWALSGLYLLLH
jgi:hypothetical protein